MPGSGLDQSEAGAGGARSNRSAAERREEQAPSPDSTQTRDPGEKCDKMRAEIITIECFVQKSVNCP